jgi:hypothetical protein
MFGRIVIAFNLMFIRLMVGDKTVTIYEKCKTKGDRIF